MKELSIEEKAKAYDEAIEKAKIWQEHLYDVNDKDYADELNYIFPELKKSEDERIRKGLLYVIEHHPTLPTEEAEEYVAWLEKQAEHANFRNKIQIGDKVTRNRDGVLVNLSQLNRVAKKDEKQGEQKPAWSEEDVAMLDSATAFVEHSPFTTIGKGRNSVIAWLKYLKDRVQPQSKQEWKPSNEQMAALNYVVNLMASSERPTENDLYYNILKSLREQLKKLREE